MEIYATSRELWGIFSKYHYLTEDIPTNGKVYVGYIKNEPVGCVVMSKFPHPSNPHIWKISRVVVLPHWQGYNIGMRMAEFIAKECYGDCDVRITTTLPIVHNYLWKNKDKWHLRFQGIRKKEDSGKSASMSKGVREVYMETYRNLNGFSSKDKISRTRCPKDKKKTY